MADILRAFAGASAMTITLTSLADGSGRQSDEVDNSTNKYLDALVRIKANGNSASNTGNLEIYAFADLGNDVRTDGAGASDAAITVLNAPLIGIITMNGSTGVTGGPFSVAMGFGGILPSAWGIIVQNESGDALSSTGGDFDVDFDGIYQTG